MKKVIAIVGLGLIGGSYARGLSKKGFWVDAIDTDPDSIAYALEHPTVSRPFVREHARELDDEVIDRHIALFVNRYSLTLGEEGRRAVRELTGLPDLRLGWEPLHGS